MIEQLTGKYEFKNYLAPDTEEKVVVIGACLISRDNEVKVKVNKISTIGQELDNILHVIRWLGVDNDLYEIIDDNTILFVNGSSIIFYE